jgi:hypothetical protein
MKAMKKIGKAIVGLALIVATAAVSGFTFFMLWNWLLVPIYKMDEINFIEALATLLVVRFASHSASDRNSSPTRKTLLEDLLENVSFAISFAALALLFGWVIKSLL